MPLLMQCPHCGQRMSVPDHAIGRVVRCPCGQVFQVPPLPTMSPQSPGASGSPASVATPKGDAVPGWSAAYQQLLQQQALQQQALQQQAGRPGAAYPQQGGYPPTGYPPTASPQGWPQPGPRQPGPGLPGPGQPGVGQPGVGQPRVGQPGVGQPGVGPIEPVKPTSPKPKKGHTRQANLDVPLEMPADVGPSNLIPPKSPAPADSTTSSDPNAPASPASIPDTWEPHWIGDDKPTSAGGVRSAGDASPYGVAGPTPAGGVPPAPLGQWISDELSQPAMPKANLWNQLSGGVVEEMPVLRGRLFGSHRRYRSASSGIKGSPGGLVRAIVAIPMLFIGTLYTVCGGVLSVGIVVIICGGLMKIVRESTTVDPVKLGGGLLGLSAVFMITLVTTFGGLKCLAGVLGILRNERRGASDAATGSGTVLALTLLYTLSLWVMADIAEQMGSVQFIGPVFFGLRILLTGFFAIIASLCLLVILWCNTAGQRMPK